MLTQIQLNDIGCNKDSCAGTVLLHRAAFQWANSTRPLSSIHSAGHWSTRKWKEKTRKETRKEKRNFTPSLGHFRFFLQSREKGLEGYIYMYSVYCIHDDVNHVDSNSKCVYVWKLSNHSLFDWTRNKSGAARVFSAAQTRRKTRKK